MNSTRYFHSRFDGPNKLFRTAAVLAGLAGLLGEGSVHAKSADKRPNIVVMLVDDMGFSDLGCYGSELATPNLDKLAGEGVRFTQFHNTARCCPTRTALLTGLYPHEAGVGHMTEAQLDDKGQVLPGYSGHLNDQCVTIAEVLKKAGYFTAMTGKWHVGQNHGVTPWGRGFERTLTSASGGFYFPDSRNTELFYNGQSVGRTNAPLPPDWYSSDLWVDYGLKFADEARTEKKPFFLYVAFNAPHFPLQAPQEDIARWRGKFMAGWDKLREARYQRQLASGLIDKSWPLSERLPEVLAWDSLSAAEKDRFDHIMAVYAAVLERMDRAVGTLVEGLRQRGELDNTLILFMSDNGGNAETGPRGRLDGAHPGDGQSSVFVGQSWATLNNTPFVRYKHYTDEGGIATPLIAHWPKGIPAKRNGAFEKQPGHVIDIMATCVDVAKTKYPQEFNGKAIKPVEGVSLRPAFAGKDIHRQEPIFWEHEENRAVLSGDWKLVALGGQPWRLYNIKQDRTEQHDLAAAEPKLAEALAKQWDAYAARANVLPLGGWRMNDDKKVKKGQGLAGSKKKHFELKADEHLDTEQAPDLKERALTVTADYEVAAPNGVIVAQGGLVHGYALYLQDGKLVFSIRQNGKITSIASPEPTIEAHKAVAQLKADGAMTLQVDGNVVATGKAPGLFTGHPKDGLDVGEDTGGLVGPYKAANHFGGNIRSVVIDLEKP